MPQFEFRGTSRTGQQITGVRASPSREALDAVLRREQITPTRIVEKGREIAIPKPKVAGKVTQKELAVFTRQFSVMIDAGLPLVQCLEILGGQQENKGFAKALTGVRGTVEAGSTLANALRLYPKIFDDLYSNMVEAGETGGILDTILQRLSTYIEKAVKLRRAVQSAMIYPVAVIAIAALVIFALLRYAVPTFATLFAGLGVELPLPTRIVIGLSNSVVSFGWMVILAVGALLYGLKVWYGTPGGRMAVDTVVLKIPLIGTLMRKISVARFTRTLGTLITSGVPMLEALAITARTSGNAVGEKTGALDAMLQKVADFYEDEVDAAVGDLLTAMEPMIILFLGVIVGGVVISLYLPLFALIGK